MASESSLTASLGNSSDLLCMCALVQLGRRFATCPVLLLAIFMNPLGLGTGQVLDPWSPSSLLAADANGVARA